MRLLSDNEFNNNNIIIIIIINVIINGNIIVILYKMFLKRVNKTIKRKRRNYDIYNNLKVYIITRTLFTN